MQFRHTEFDDTVNVTQEHPLKTFAKYMSAAAGALIGIYIITGLLVDLTAEHIGHDTEIWIGEIAQKHIPVVTPPGLKAEQAYINKLFASIPKDGLPALPYRVVVVADNTPNAFALPGGQIRIHSSLLTTIPTESGILFVLGHELGHYANRDHLKGLGRGLVFAAFSTVLLGENHSSAALLKGISQLSQLQFSRNQEYEADKWGLKLLHARNKHVGGATDFFASLLHAQSGLPSSAEFMLTHPVSENRINAMNALIKTLGYTEHSPSPQPFYREPTHP